MTVAASENDRHGGILPRSRSMKNLVIAGVLLTIVWTIKKSPLFRDHYESGFSVVNPSHHPFALPTATLAPGAVRPPQPIALPGDNFFVGDALHHALNPPKPPPPPPPAPVPFPNNVAVIMETDPSRVPNLVPVMLHFANVLGPAWPVVLVTLRAKWEEPPSPAFRRLMREQRVRIFFLPEDTTFPDHESVSYFLTKPWLWEQFESAGRVLMFQADSVLCSRSERRVEDFLEWDLVGAPISSQYGVGYNGGLSLRNPKMVLELLRDPERNTFERRLRESKTQSQALRETEGEDAAKAAEGKIASWEKFEDQWFFVKFRDEMPEAKLPLLEVARNFAVETVWEERPLGYHQPFRWLTAAQKEKVMEWCPEVGLLQGGSHYF